MTKISKRVISGNFIGALHTTYFAYMKSGGEHKGANILGEEEGMAPSAPD